MNTLKNFDFKIVSLFFGHFFKFNLIYRNVNRKLHLIVCCQALYRWTVKLNVLEHQILIKKFWRALHVLWNKLNLYKFLQIYHVFLEIISKLILWIHAKRLFVRAIFNLQRWLANLYICFIILLKVQLILKNLRLDLKNFRLQRFVKLKQILFLLKIEISFGIYMLLNALNIFDCSINIFDWFCIY